MLSAGLLTMEAYDHTEEVIAWLIIVGCVASVFVMFLCFMGTVPYAACCWLRGCFSGDAAATRSCPRRRVDVAEVEVPILGELDNQTELMIGIAPQ